MPFKKHPGGGAGARPPDSRPLPKRPPREQKPVRRRLGKSNVEFRFLGKKREMGWSSKPTGKAGREEMTGSRGPITEGRRKKTRREKPRPWPL